MGTTTGTISFWKIVDGKLVTGRIGRYNAFVDKHEGTLTYNYSLASNTLWVTAHPAKGVKAQPITIPVTVTKTVDWTEGIVKVTEVVLTLDGTTLLLYPDPDNGLYIPKYAAKPPAPRISLVKLTVLWGLLISLIPIGIALGWDNGFFAVLGRMTAVTAVFLLLFGFREKPKS